MLKKMLSLLTILLLLSSCVQQRFAMMADPHDGDTDLQIRGEYLEAVLVVDEEFGDAFVQAAEYFAQTVSGMTGGRFQVQVRHSGSLGTAMAAGEVQFTFLDSLRHQDLCRGFEAVSTRFLYPGYTTFSMAVNSEQMLDMLGEELREGAGLLPLGGFYQPSRYLVSTWQPNDYQQFGEAVIAVDPETGSREVFERLGASIADLSDPGERLELILEGWADGAGAEFTLEEIMALPWEAAEADLYLSLTGHTITPAFFAVDNSFYNGLSDVYQAVVREAMSGMYQRTDAVVLMEHREAVETLREQGMLVYQGDFSAMRAVALQTVNEEGEPTLSPQRQYVLELVSRLG